MNFFAPGPFLYVLLLKINCQPKLEIMKEETLEEAAEMNETIAWELAKERFEKIEGYAPDINNKNHVIIISSLQEGILTGAKWQAERMYSEEEVLELLWKREWSYEYSMPFITVDEWFEQNKKK
jgi:hypothetical protein